MKTVVALLALVAIAAAAPQKTQQGAYVVKENPSSNIGLDSYSFGYELSDGQTRQESAQLETRGAEESVLRVSGSYTWVDPVTGQLYEVTYIADENGFQPTGVHLPKVPA